MNSGVNSSCSQIVDVGPDAWFVHCSLSTTGFIMCGLTVLRPFGYHSLCSGFMVIKHM